MAYMVRAMPPKKPEQRYECFDIQPGSIREGRIGYLLLVNVTSIHGRLCAVDELRLEVEPDVDIDIEPSLF